MTETSWVSYPVSKLILVDLTLLVCCIKAQTMMVDDSRKIPVCIYCNDITLIITEKGMIIAEVDDLPPFGIKVPDRGP